MERVLDDERIVAQHRITDLAVVVSFTPESSLRLSGRRCVSIEDKFSMVRVAGSNHSIPKEPMSPSRRTIHIPVHVDVRSAPTHHIKEVMILEGEL
jgi:hypothetical protein